MLETKITLNEQEIVMTYDWSAQVKAEELTGINLLAPSPDSRSFRALFLARCLKHQPDMTVEMADALIPLNVGKISEALHVIGENQEDPEAPEVEEEKKEEEVPANA